MKIKKQKKPRNKLRLLFYLLFLVMMTTAGGLGGLTVYADEDPRSNTTTEIINTQSGSYTGTTTGSNRSYTINWTAYTTRQKKVYFNQTTQKYDTQYGQVEYYLLATRVNTTVYETGTLIGSFKYTYSTVDSPDIYGQLQTTVTTTNNTYSAQIPINTETQTLLYYTRLTSAVNVTGANIYAGDITSTVITPQSGTTAMTATRATIMGYSEKDTLNTWYTQEDGLEEKLDALLTAIQGPENTADDKDTITTQKEQATADKEALNEMHLTEQEITNQADQSIAEVNPQQMLTTGTPQRLKNAFEFIRNVHAATIERTAIKNYIGFVMILGLSAYIIGRRRG